MLPWAPMDDYCACCFALRNGRQSTLQIRHIVWKKNADNFLNAVFMHNYHISHTITNGDPRGGVPTPGQGSLLPKGKQPNTITPPL